MRWPIVTAVLALVAGLAAAPASAATLPPPTRLGTDITAYLKLPGDRVVVVPDGRYTARPVTAPHPVTSGPHRGRLILVAQNRGGVVVDLASAPLALDAGTSGITFVGFKFVNGTIEHTKVRDIRYWYTDHTYPIEVWHAEYKAKGGVLDRMVHRTPTTVRAKGSDRITFRGSDFHDIGDDAFSGYNTRDLAFQGVRIWNVDEKTYDPGTGGGSAKGDLIHNDAVATTGGLVRLSIRSSYVGQRIYLGAENAPVTDLVMEDTWLTKSRSAGLIDYSDGSNAVTGRRTDVRSWGHLGKGGQDRVDEIAGRVYLSPNLNPRPIKVVDSGIVRTAPAAGTSDPAVRWRAANPYGGWSNA